MGFAPPPSIARVKLLLTKIGGTLFVQPSGECAPGEIVDWLSATRPRIVTLGERRVLRADYAPVPTRWNALFREVSVEVITLQPDGSARVDVMGSHGRITEFSALLTQGGASAELRRVGPVRQQREFLTAAQEAALRAAVAAGYYKIPRPLNLHALARRMDVTAASLSERLRRAEGRVITQYVELGCPRLERTGDEEDSLLLPGAGEAWREDAPPALPPIGGSEP